jgi:hypothetical protein
MTDVTSRRTESVVTHQQHLRQLFPEGEIYVVSDDEWLRQAGSYYGLTSVPLTDAESLPHGANVVLFLRHQLVSAQVRRMFLNARVLTVPIASFDDSLDAALYTQKLAMLTDYEAACTRARYWIDGLTNNRGSVVFHDRDGTTQLLCSLADDLTADAHLVPVIDVGQWISVGSYCEISITARPAKGRRPFSLNGVATASGVLVARDPRCTEAGDARIRAAARLREELTARVPITLHLEDSILTRVTAGGKNFTTELCQVTNPDHNLHALELGIGTNQDLLPHVNWTVNSQLNEGVGPVHLGFGEGITGAHMDFIVPDGGHEFRSIPA